MSQVLAVIPARSDSRRFPGKPLADRTGKPLVQHVVDAAARAASVHRVVVATDDPRIEEAVLRFGGQCVMTRDDHPNGTSRIAEAVERLAERGVHPELVVNVQGDEPEIEPEVIDALVNALRDDPAAPMATLASPFAPHENPADPHIVKIVRGVGGRALYFSRSLIPFDRDGVGVERLKHPGLYAYRPDFLATYLTLEPTPLEVAEHLEQLRVLEHGFPIATALVEAHHHGIDTPAQYDAFVERHRRTASVDAPPPSGP